MNRSRLHVAHTANLTTEDLAAARVLIFEVSDDANEDDWEHCLGGMHAIIWEGDRMIAHGSVIQRRLIYRGRPLRTGYVEGVAVRADRRRRGHGAAVMAELERVIRGAYELGALSSSEDGIPFYIARGWKRWQGLTYALTPGGIIRTPEDDDGVFLLPVSESLDLSADLTCDFRPGDLW